MDRVSVVRNQGAKDVNQPQVNLGLAAVLSLVIPGAGQMYRGHVIRGLIWLVVVCIGYMAFVIPGLVLHLACILLAAMR